MAMSPNCVDTEQIPSKMVAGDREILGIGENPKSFGESRVEGKLGNAKRRYGLDRIMAKRDDTSETVIGMIVLVMNMEKVLRDLLFVLFDRHTLAGQNDLIRSVIAKLQPDRYRKAA